MKIPEAKEKTLRKILINVLVRVSLQAFTIFHPVYTHQDVADQVILLVKPGLVTRANFILDSKFST